MYSHLSCVQIIISILELIKLLDLSNLESIGSGSIGA